MSNVKISQLPVFTGNTSGSYVVMDDSTLTTTYRVTRENLMFPYTGSANIKGDMNIVGTLNLSGSNPVLFATGTLQVNGPIFQHSEDPSNWVTGGTYSTEILNYPYYGKIEINSWSGSYASAVNGATRTIGLFASQSYFDSLNNNIFKEGPSIYTNYNTGSNSKVSMIGFRNTTGYTGPGTISLMRSTEISGSLNVLTTGINRLSSSNANQLWADYSVYGNSISAYGAINDIRALQNYITATGTGSYNAIYGPTQITGSLNVSGSARTLTVNNKLYVTASANSNSAEVEVRGVQGYSSIYPGGISSVSFNNLASLTAVGDAFGNPNIYFSKSGITSTISADTNGIKIDNSVKITGSLSISVNSLSIASNTASLDLSIGDMFTLQLVSGSATNLNPTNIKPGQTISVFVNTTGSATMTFPSSVKQISGSTYIPTITTGIDILTFISKDNSSLYLVNAKNFI